MAVFEETPIISITANGVATYFPREFTILEEGDLVVQGTLDNVTTVYDLGVDYEISGVGASAGGVTFFVAPVFGTVVTQYRDISINRLTDYQDNGDLLADTVNRDFDRIVLMLQDIFNGGKVVPTCLRVPNGETIDALPAAASRAGYYLGFDGDGQPVLLLAATGTAAALASDLVTSDDALKGDAMVAVRNPGTGGVGRTQHEKNRDLVHVLDFGAVGDGSTDDATALANAIAESISRGVQLHFDGTKSYRVASSSWSIAAGARMVTNGCTFICDATTTGNTVWLTIGDNVVIDELNISVPTGVRRDRVVLVDGDDTRIGKIKVHSVDQQANSEAADGAVQITGLRPYVGLVDIKNYDRALIVYSSTDATILKPLIESYVRGIYGYDNVNLHVGGAGGGRIHTASPNASGTAGHNGVLLGCNSTDAQRNVVFENVHVSDAGEHAWRVGGPEQQSNLRFSNCSAHNCGGSGFKVLGTDSGTPTARNKSITLDNFIAEDVGEDSGLSATNRCGVYFAFCDDFQIGTPIVRPRNNANSAQYCLHIQACSDGVITSPILREAVFDGLLIYASNGDNTNIQVNGGEARGCDRHGVNVLTDASMSTGRCVIDGFNSVANSDLGFNINNSGTMSENLFRIKTYANTNGMGACNNSPGTTLQISGTPGSTAISGISARNGSWIDDNTTLNIRKAGAWTAL